MRSRNIALASLAMVIGIAASRSLVAADSTPPASTTKSTTTTTTTTTTAIPGFNQSCTSSCLNGLSCINSVCQCANDS